MIDIELLQDLSEVIHYDTDDIPYALQERKLSQYTDMRAFAHWHKDLEFIHIFDGEMYYDINGEKKLLKKGESIIVNSHQLHFGYSHHRRECDFICFLFHPELLNSNLHMYQKYVEPLIKASDLPCWFFDSDSLVSQNAALTLPKLCAYHHRKHPRCDYYMVGYLYALWNQIYDISKTDRYSQSVSPDPDLSLQKKMVNYIYQNYSENIELANIAAAANISRSKCCKIFQKYLQQSPISYLNAYRMSLSCTLLRDTSYSVTEIATTCGYNHLSYFSKMFFKKYGCTPHQFRKQAETSPATFDTFPTDVTHP